MYRSGTEDLFENTLAFLKYDRRAQAQCEVRTERTGAVTGMAPVHYAYARYTIKSAGRRIARPADKAVGRARVRYRSAVGGGSDGVVAEVEQPPQPGRGGYAVRSDLHLEVSHLSKCISAKNKIIADMH